MSYGLGVIHTDEKTYREQWAVLTGRSEKDIYIPEALRTTPILEPRPPQPQEPENN